MLSSPWGFRWLAACEKTLVDVTRSMKNALNPHLVRVLVNRVEK